MPTVKKLPKWAIRQAGGINKKAWALARRGKGRKMAKAKPSKRPRRTPRAVSGASHTNSKPGWGRYFKMGRTADIFSGPAQGSVSNAGFTMEAGDNALNRYSGGLSRGELEPETAKATIGSIATGLVRDWFRSKMGVYRGLGQKKLLSGVMAANPEILASTEINPVDNVVGWNGIRTDYDRAYIPQSHEWNLRRGRIWRSLGLDVGLKVTQKVAEKYINPMLPKGYNF